MEKIKKIVGKEPDGKAIERRGMLSKQDIGIKFFNAKIPVARIRKNKKGGFTVYLYPLDTKYCVNSDEDVKRVIAEIKLK